MIRDKGVDADTSALCGRATPLYRQRRAHLALLAALLDESGHDGVVVEPEGMPVLELRSLGVSGAEIVATVGYGDVDWFRWMRGDFITPCSELLTATREVVRVLRSRPVARIA